MTSDNHRPNQGPTSENDILDQATAALQSVPIPPEPPALLESTLAAVRAGSVSDGAGSRIIQPSTTRRRIVMRILGYSSLATAAAVLIGTGIVFLGTPKLSAAAEFKTAMENAAKAKNMVALNTQKLTPNSPELKMRLTAQGPFIRVDILNPGGAPGAPTVKELPVIVTMLIDQTRGKSVQLNHFAKTAQTEDIPNRPGESGFPDLVAGFRHLQKAEGITAAGEELLGTVKTKRFTLKTAEFLGGKGPCDVTVWIDPKSGLPVKVRLESNVPKKVDGKLVPSGDKSLILFEDFQFDVKLNDSLFQFEAPKGYTTKAVVREKDGSTKPK
jgi:hypothetical protein